MGFNSAFKGLMEHSAALSPNKDWEKSENRTHAFDICVPRLPR